MTAQPTPPSDPDLARAEVLFASRDDAARLEQAAALFEKSRAFTRAARACCQRFGLHADLDDDAKEQWIERGIENACRALGASDVDAVLEAMPSFKKEQAEAIYWLATAWGAKIETVNPFRRLGMVKTLRRLFERANELDASVLRSAPRRMKADFLLTAPGMFGGDAEKGKVELEAAIAAEPDYVEGYVLRAEKVRAPAKDRAGFLADLKRAEATKDDAIPEAIPEQKGSKRDAKKLLAREAELFD